MTIKQFISAAIEGGYEIPRGYNCQYCPDAFSGPEPIKFHTMILDPKAWQAVGKVKGWGKRCRVCGGTEERCNEEKYRALKEINDPGIIYPSFLVEGWHFHMHRMIDLLAIGFTIEDFIATIKN